MMNLSEYRNRNARLADYLPWAALVGQGVVLNKDGSFQRTAKFRGPDLDSAVAAELVAVAGRVNNAFRRLGSGWAIFVEGQRSGAATYPDSLFPDPASALVDAERKAGFEEDASHFVSGYFLTFLYLPPAEDASRAESWLYEGREQTGVDPWEILRGFVDRTDRVLALLDGFMPECRWLDDGETLTYLHSTISTNRHKVRVPETPMYLDALLADQPLAGGLEPRLGDAHLRILTITGFPSATTPGILDDLNRLAFPYRWSTRAVLMDKTDAVRLLTKIRRQWFAKRKSIAAILKEIMTNEQSALMDSDASNKGPTSPASPMSPRRSPSGIMMHAGPTRSCGWSRRSFRAVTSPPCRKPSMPSMPGSALCPDMLMQMSASRPSRRSTLPIWRRSAPCGRDRNGTITSVHPRCCMAGPKGRPRSGFLFMSATSGTRSSSARPARASRCCSH
jgi:type IV secretory pathway VirB4 component